MPIVDENRLKGNYGEAYVTARLSSECLVRPVANGTDIGVDLFCETVEKDTPFLHFWIQIKAGAQCRLNQDGQSASYQFEVEDLVYWNRQPVPVFAALVPVNWPVSEDPDVFIIDLTFQLLLGIQGGSRYVTLPSNYTWPAGDRNCVKQFLKVAVPFDVARLQCRSGIVGSIPTLHPSYVQHSPIVPVSRFMEPILRQIRTTAANSIDFLHQLGELNNSTAGFRRRLASIIEQFGDLQNWELFNSRALSYHADKNFSQAIEYYDKAIRCIQNDPNVREIDPWPDLVKKIEGQKEKARREENV